MKAINQIKLDKIIGLIFLIVMDFVTTYLLAHLVLSVWKGEFNFNTLVLLIFSLGFSPFVVVQHLKNVPKFIEAKLIYLMVFSASLVFSVLSLTDLLRNGFIVLTNGVLNLGTGVLFSIASILLLIKLFSEEEVGNESKSGIVSI